MYIAALRPTSACPAAPAAAGAAPGLDAPLALPPDALSLSPAARRRATPVDVELFASPPVGYGTMLSTWLEADASAGRQKIVRYDWDFGDGFYAYDDGPTPFHTYQDHMPSPYAHTDTFIARVRAYAADGGWGESEALITLNVPGQ